MALILSCSVHAGPISVTLTGVLGSDSPFGSAGTEYVFSFTVDELATASSVTSVNGTGNTATFSNRVTAVSFLTMATSVEGAPTNTMPDSNLLIISDNVGQSAIEDQIQAFVELPDQGAFTELFFGLQLLDSHAASEPAPDSVTSLGLDVFSLLDITDFAEDPDGPQISNSQLVFTGSFNGAVFSDLTSTITSISVTPSLVTAPSPGPGSPGPVQAPEPGMVELLFFSVLLGAWLRRPRRMGFNSIAEVAN